MTTKILQNNKIIKETDLSNIFGTIKKRKMSAQTFKDMVRKGWEK